MTKKYVNNSRILRKMWILTSLLLLSAIFFSNASKSEVKENQIGAISQERYRVWSEFKDGSGASSEVIEEIFPDTRSQSAPDDKVENPGSIFKSPSSWNVQEFSLTEGHFDDFSKGALHPTTESSNKGFETQAKMSEIVHLHEELRDSPDNLANPSRKSADPAKNRPERRQGSHVSKQRPRQRSARNSQQFSLTKTKLRSDIPKPMSKFQEQAQTDDNDNGSTEISEDYDYNYDETNAVYTLAHFRQEVYAYVEEQVETVNGSIAEILTNLQQTIAKLENQLTESMAYTSVLETKIRVSAAPQHGDIRLLSRDRCGRVSRAGYLLFYTGITWGFVCDDFFNAAAVKVACIQLGYPEPRSALDSDPKMSPSAEDTPMNKRWQDSYDIVLDDVQCTGEETTLDSCRHFELGHHDCAMNEVVYLSC